MKQMLIGDVLKPITRRVGAYVAGWATSVAVLSPYADDIEMIAVAITGLVIDLILSKMGREQ